MSGEGDKEIEEKKEGEENDEVPEMEEASGPPKHEPFSVKVFGIAKGQQSANGLRHNDNLRYRQYCTRRLRRLRATLRWKNGKGRGKQVAFPSDFQDWRFLEFPLVCAERAWSYGVQLKSDNATANTWQPRWRLHSIRRFSKAVKWADFLENACKRHGDQRTQREAEAYASFMSGTLLLEKEEWAEALAKLQKCRKVCEHLALASEQAESQLFKEHARQLAPAIRECKYNLGLGYDEDDGEDVARTGKATLSEFCYRGHGLASPSEKVKAHLLKCLQLVGAIKVGSGEQNAAVIEKYGELSAEFGDALKEIHSDMITAGSAKEGDAAGPSEKEWALLEAFAREQNICMNIERNLVLLGNLLEKLDGLEDIASSKARQTCRPEEGMRYCDLLKEDLESLRELPETSSQISTMLEAYISVALNCRCFFLGLCHMLTGKSLESAALLDMLRARLDDTTLEAALEEPLGRLHALFASIVGGMPKQVSQWKCRGLTLLVTKAPKAKEQGDESKEEATFPPRVRDIPCKPLLFDLAFPCIEGPDFEELLPKGRSSQGEEKGPGLMGKVAGGVGSVAGGIGSRLGSLWGRK